MDFPVTYDALQPYLLAKGKERACYRNPVNTNTVIKLSHCSCARQSLRELTYFEVLKRRKVPATHIPFFVGRVNIPGYVGIEQQLICDFDGSPSKSLFYYLSNKTSSIYFQLPDLLEALYHFLYRYGIALSDLSGNNILIRREKTGINRAVMIDGFGTTDLIPICHYFPHFARMKILRHWERFLPKIHLAHPQTTFEINSSSMEMNTLLP